MKTNRHSISPALLLLAGLALSGLPAHAVSGRRDRSRLPLKGVDGKTYSLADFKGKAVVLEWINPNCPFSDRHAREKTMSDLHKKYGAGRLARHQQHQRRATATSSSRPSTRPTTRRTASSIRSSTTRPARSATPTTRRPRRTCSSSIRRARSSTTARSTTIRAGRKAKAERANYVDGGLGAEQAGKAINPASTKAYGCSVKY